MASTRVTYPTIPAKAWWALREKFDQTVPTKVTPSYLATVLESQENSVRANVLPGLRAVGLIDEDGVPTQRANQWRDAEGYPDACRNILREVYPRELREAVPDPSSDREAAKRWFKNNTGCGENAAVKMTSLYCRLVDAEPKEENGSRRRAKSKKRATSKARTGGTNAPPASEPGSSNRVPVLNRGAPDLPEVRLSLEIRIDGSVTPEQIDQIFASMANHLYGRDDEGR